MTTASPTSALKDSVAKLRAQVQPRRRQPRWTLAYATSLIAQWRASGLSLYKFALQLKLDHKRLSYWHRRVLRAGTLDEIPAPQTSPIPAFIPVVQQAPPTPSHTIEIVFRGLTLRIRESIDAATLLPLLTALAHQA